MMRILWVKMGGLWPPTSGGRTRSLQILSQLSRRHQVSVVTTHGNGDDADGLVAQLPRCERVRSFAYDVPKRGDLAFPWAVARSWFSRDPVDLRKWRVPEVRKCADALIGSGQIDVCVSDFLFAAHNVPMGGPVPTVLFEHNVEYLIWKRLCDLETVPWKKALLALEWRKLRAREAAACDAANLTIAVSDDDRQRLATLAPKAAITWIPTGVDTDYFHPDTDRERPAHMVFSGSMDWHPNEDAVRYFLADIFPLIRAEVPDASFTVVGRNPTNDVRELAAAAGAGVTGTLDDIRPAIHDAAICVVPLRAGSGTRLKIFEALAMGKAVVSTTVGAEGLDIEPGRHYVAADGARAFADAVIALVKNPERRRRIAAAGRDLVESRYSWAQVAVPFEQHLQATVDAHANTRTAPGRHPDLSPAGSAR
jgi:glycosyltransferase involved in cell wall biosynthesis